MDAQCWQIWRMTALWTSLGTALFGLFPVDVYAAGARTRNFMVQAASPELAREVAEAAEAYRRDLAIEWIGRELPPWQDICPITVNAAPNLGAGGATSFAFMNGQPGRWTMTIQGSRERVLDSVLPHEITHTIFATHFGRPLPRWADEGACTVVEHTSERTKQERMLYEFLTTNRGIPFNKMFAMKDYPQDVLPLYSQGYSLSRFFIALGGRQKFVAYVGDGMASNNWTTATQQHYGFDSLSDLQLTWVEWVRKGTPAIRSPHDIVYCSTDQAKHGRTLGEVNGLTRDDGSSIALASATGPASPRTNALPREIISNSALAGGAESGPSQRIAALPVNSTPLDANFFARQNRQPPANPLPGSMPNAVRPNQFPVDDTQNSAGQFNSLSRPLPAETVRPAPLGWSSRENALAPSGTAWR